MYTQIRVSVFVCLAVVFLLLVGAGAIGAANGQFVAAAPPRPPVFEFLEFVGIILFGSHKTSRFFLSREKESESHQCSCLWLAAVGLLLWVSSLALGLALTATIGFGLLLLSHCIDACFEMWKELRDHVKRVRGSE